jgi:hypothetical protein
MQSRHVQEAESWRLEPTRQAGLISFRFLPLCLLCRIRSTMKRTGRITKALQRKSWPALSWAIAKCEAGCTTWQEWLLMVIWLVLLRLQSELSVSRPSILLSLRLRRHLHLYAMWLAVLLFTMPDNAQGDKVS